MIAIDTNVLVRYLVQDDPVQGPLATRLIEAAADRGESIYLSCVVLAESAWVLTSVYRLPRSGLIAALLRILASAGESREVEKGTPQFAIENYEAVSEAVDDYAGGRADFADCLIGRLAHAAGAITTYTFDKEASTAATFKNVRRT